MTSPTAARMPGVQIPSRAAAASTGVPGLGTHTAAPVPAPFFTVDRPKGPRDLVGATDGPRAPIKASSASEAPAPRRRRRGRPRDRFRPRRDRRSSRHRLDALPGPNHLETASKIKKKPPTAMILGNESRRRRQGAGPPRGAELRCLGVGLAVTGRRRRRHSARHAVVRVGVRRDPLGLVRIFHVLFRRPDFQ